MQPELKPASSGSRIKNNNRTEHKKLEKQQIAQAHNFNVCFAKRVLILRPAIG
jgi:hypothetical protein